MNDAPTVSSIRDRIRGASGVNMDAFIFVILAVDLFVVVGVVWATGAQQAAWIVPIVLGAPLAVFWLITFILWKPWERRFPAQPQRADAVVKMGQSVAMGRGGNMNNCLIVAADAHHLHLIPFMPMRLVGAKVVSIPWERFTEVGEPPKFKFALTKAKIDDRWRFAAPEWAMGVGRVGVDDRAA